MVQGWRGSGQNRRQAAGPSKGKRDQAERRDISKVKCFNCDEFGHYSRQCRKPRRQRRAEANLVQGEEEPTLLMAHVMGVSLAGEATLDRTPSVQEVHLTEKKVNLDHDDVGEEDKAGDWFLDTGATNHMTGARTAFAELDTGVVGTVRFGNGSVIEIRGRGTVVFRCKNGDHRYLEGVLHPKAAQEHSKCWRLAAWLDSHIEPRVFRCVTRMVCSWPR